jgi:hypothetical protein
VNLGNAEAGLVKRYLRHGVASVPARKALHLSKLLRAGGLVSADGRLRYVDQLHRIRTPIFVGAGSIDGNEARPMQESSGASFTRV